MRIVPSNYGRLAAAMFTIWRVFPSVEAATQRVTIDDKEAEWSSVETVIYQRMHHGFVAPDNK
jgi:hypothetical protein